MEQVWRLQTQNLNITSIKEFVFAGFPGVSKFPELIGLTFTITYILTLLGNIFIFYVVKKQESLRTPMFIIICNLAFSDVIYSTVITPKIIQIYLFGNNTIKSQTCFLQMYFLYFAGSVDSYILLVMAMDRYVSICHPLRYPTLITNKNTHLTCLVAWIIGALSPVGLVTYASGFPYCGPNVISHLYCDYGLIVKLACTETSSIKQTGTSIVSIVLIGVFVLILLSYLRIIISVLKIATTSGRKKAAYTCSTQLIVIAIYFLPRLFVYIAFTAGLSVQGEAELRVCLGIFYCLVPPLVNPIIYSFRLNEIKQFVYKLLKQGKITNTGGQIKGAA
ncbi:olfactory receptor 10G8-like [Erpetoichthys calabaricus]|uniref:olfactory receptor 10G8-like n=1 Tax=Erpetoichthys calabaricus TaxID=27687 RepID=UPI002233FB94|nr:olfactory receptor 10G8-like [Erpetoichthys calabaricus]